MKVLLGLCLTLLMALPAWSQTIAERHGQLTVDGNRIKDGCGRIVQLKGMSYFWSQWEGSEYYNADAVKWLRDDWKVEIVRAALGVRGANDDYIGNPQANLDRVTAVLDGAVQHGIYGIADFHAHYANNYTTGAATTFFRTISQRYSGKPNIVYEIWNEPIGEFGDAGGRTTWRAIKAYAREIISVIRDNDPNGLIVVGTPFYDQRPDLAAEDPLTVDSKGRPVGNVAYTIHAYAGAHRQQIRDYGQKALDKGLALFMTESGRDGTNYGPNNNIDAAEWNAWEAWMDARGISYTKWSLSSKNETGSSLQPGAPARGGWTDAQLRPEGRWNRDHFRRVNATMPEVCSNASAEDNIVTADAPSSVSPGAKVTVTTSYNASTARDLRVVFQLDEAPYTVYAEEKLDVVAGKNSAEITLNLPSNLPVGTKLYKFETYLTTNEGGWQQRLDNISKPDVSVVAVVTPPKVYGIFVDGFENQWADWSWGGTATPNDGLSILGSKSFKYDLENGGGAVSFRHPNGVSGDNLIGVEFWARTWSGTTDLKVSGSFNDSFNTSYAGKAVVVNTTYQKFTVPKAELGNFNWYKRFFLQTSDKTTVFIDDFKLLYKQ